jgi:hypothetical protein
MPLISMIWLATRWFRIIGLEVDIRASAELRQRLLRRIRYGEFGATLSEDFAP